jgi:hypothetical protein
VTLSKSGLATPSASNPLGVNHIRTKTVIY